MKEASGELNMTVVTIVAIAAVGAFFYAFIWPSIQKGIANNTCANICPAPVAGSTKKAEAQKDANGKYDQCNCPDGSVQMLDDSQG